MKLLFAFLVRSLHCLCSDQGEVLIWKLCLSNSGAVSEQTSMKLLFFHFFVTFLMNVPLYHVILMHSDDFWSV